MLLITGIDIANFRGVTALSARDIRPTALVVGLNGDGKSSVIYAIQMALLGKCPLTSANGAGSAVLIRDGQESANITLDLNCSGQALMVICNIRKVMRKDGPGATIEWKCFDASGAMFAESQDELWRRIGIDAKHAEVAMMPGAFVESNALGDILAKWLGHGVDIMAAVPAERHEWVRKFGAQHGNKLTTLEDFAAIGKAAENLLRATKKQKASAVIEADAMPFTALPTDATGKQVPLSELPGVQSTIARLKGQHEDLLIELGNATNSADETELDAYEATAADLEAKLAEARERATACTMMQDAADVALQEARVAESGAVHAHTTAQRDLESAKKAVAALQNKDGECPTCKRKYTPELRKTLIDPLEKAVETHTAAMEAAGAKRDELRKALAGFSDSVTTARNARSETAAAVNDLTRRLAEARTVCETARVARRTPETINGEIDTIAARIERATEAEKKLQLVQQRKEIDARIAILAAEIETLDWAVKAFRDGELLKSLVDGGLSEFAERVNNELAAFGYAVEFHADGKTIEPSLVIRNGVKRPMRECSNGEKVIAAMAIASAFADTGAPILIDNINDLDYANRKIVFGQLRAHTTGSILCAYALQTDGVSIDRVRASMEPCTVIDAAADASVEVAA